jgi:hypothetical protein
VTSLIDWRSGHEGSMSMYQSIKQKLGPKSNSELKPGTYSIEVKAIEGRNLMVADSNGSFYVTSFLNSSPNNETNSDLHIFIYFTENKLQVSVTHT